ncbi:MAG: dihydrolipoyl dehydrogenase [Candidatus Pelethousia sp.]|nr:dihydrolipoyl dehydrogenase [Candidatus Pelethousia sp.]
MKKDVVIIGGGPGGYVAGPILAAGGLSVACVEMEVIGGTCLKYGCMPTKSLAAVSACIEKVKHADRYGLTIGAWEVDYPAAMERAHTHVKKLAAGCESKFAKCGIAVFKGHGALKDEHTVLVTPYEEEPFEIEADKIILDVGSRSAQIAPFGSDPAILTNKEILALDELPRSLLIVGSGVMGCEFACIYANFGTKVTMVEFMDRVLPPVDADIAALMQEKLEAMGIELELGTKVESYEKKDGLYRCKLANGKSVEAEKVLVVVGRTPNSDDIGLENIAIQTTGRGHICVDEHLRTASPSIYAIGDVIGGTFAHVSRLEGEYVAKNILGADIAMDYRVVPWAIFTSLEVAGVGFTEQQAKKQGVAYTASVAKFSANGKAMVSDEGEGFVKVLAEPQNKRILGAQIIGPHASDLIHEMALAIKCNLSAQDISAMIHVHPTLAETVLKACQEI